MKNKLLGITFFLIFFSFLSFIYPVKTLATCLAGNLACGKATTSNGSLWVYWPSCAIDGWYNGEQAAYGCGGGVANRFSSSLTSNNYLQIDLGANLQIAKVKMLSAGENWWGANTTVCLSATSAYWANNNCILVNSSSWGDWVWGEVNFAASIPTRRYITVIANNFRGSWREVEAYAPPTPTPTPTPIPTSTPTPTPMPTSTPIPIPIPTPTPTSTPTPTPTSIPLQQWFQVSGGGGIIAANRTSGTSINDILPNGKHFFDPSSIGGIIIAAASASFNLDQTHPQPAERHLVTNYGPITSSYNYTYFKNKYASRDSAPDSSAGPTLPTNLTARSYYYYSNPLGSLTVNAGTYTGTAVIIVEGDLSITGNITFAANSALAFFVKGRSGGGITLNSSVTSIRGFFLTDGRFDDGASNNQLTITGGVVANDFSLRRTL